MIREPHFCHFGFAGPSSISRPTQRAPPAGLPALRGRIERFFKTAGMQALCPYTGRTFESIAAKGDYDPVARVSLTLPELCDVITRWVLDIYHNSPHIGLKGETPANCWKRLVKAYGIIPHPTATAAAPYSE